MISALLLQSSTHYQIFFLSLELLGLTAFVPYAILLTRGSACWPRQGATACGTALALHARQGILICPVAAYTSGLPDLP